MEIIMEKELIYDCPYNINLNNENSNRSYGNNIPRNIFIDSFGFVYCMSIKNKKIVIGAIEFTLFYTGDFRTNNPQAGTRHTS